MATYIGPFDVVLIDGREYHRGDTVNVAQARIDQLRSNDGYRFDGDQNTPNAPIMSNTRDDAHPPNEFGVPADPNPKSKDAQAQAAAATPSTPPVAQPAQ